MYPVVTDPAEQEQVLDEVRSAERSWQDVMNVPSDDLEIPRNRILALLTDPAILPDTLPDHERPVVRTRLPSPGLLAAERCPTPKRRLAPEFGLALQTATLHVTFAPSELGFS